MNISRAEELQVSTVNAENSLALKSTKTKIKILSSNRFKFSARQFVNFVWNFTEKRLHSRRFLRSRPEYVCYCPVEWNAVVFVEYCHIFRCYYKQKIIF